MAFDWIGAGLGIMGGLLGNGSSSARQEELLNKMLKAYGYGEDLWRNHGQWDDFVARDKEVFDNLDQNYMRDWQRDMNNYMSRNADTMMPGTSDSERGIAQGVMGSNLARQRSATMADLIGSRYSRAQAALPKTDMLSGAAGLAENVDANSGGLDWEKAFGVLSNIWGQSKKTPPSGKGDKGSGDGAGDGSGQTQTGPSGKTPAPTGPIGAAMGATSLLNTKPMLGRGMGGGSMESSSLPDYGVLPLKYRLQDRLRYGDADPEGLASDLMPRMDIGTFNRVRPRSR